ncbi:MAG: SRPBCC family protein [Candidatus Bathyarchaeota archaeon]|nr:SRPBCC family protein [Candidatus Bathyarchaeota archaeon]
MVILKDSIEIEKPPEIVYEWFNHFVMNYKSWHRKDHILAKWIKGKNFEEGSILFLEEYLDGKLEKMSTKTIKNVKNRMIGYRFLFPTSMICSGGSFNFEPSNSGSVFTAILYFRFGKVLSKIYPSKFNAIKKHMKEEGENLKNLLEKE